MILKMMTTDYQNEMLAARNESFAFHADEGVEKNVINLYPAVQFQQWEGFGGAITDSAGYVFSQMPEALQDRLVRTYFSPCEMNYTQVRIPVDSCDFSLGHYEAMSDPDDADLKSFNLSRTEQYIFPLLDAAQQAAGKNLEIMLSPWSPPAFMKSNQDRNHGGELLDTYKNMWAQYLCKYVSAFRERGYDVRRISVQNEPKAVQTWDSCIYSAEQEKSFLRDYLYPALIANRLDPIEIFVWDHNKERLYERARDLIDENTDQMIAGLAFHWYSGDHFEALDLVRQFYPGKKLILSESCLEYSKYGKTDYRTNAQRLAHDMFGNLNHGMNAFYDWNILLDEKGGPNHVSNFCEAPFMYDERENKLLEQPSLHYMGQFSRYIKKGACRIAATRYTDQIDMTAFQNPNGEIVLVMMNRTANVLPATVRLNGLCAEIVMLPLSISTCLISE